MPAANKTKTLFACGRIGIRPRGAFGIFGVVLINLPGCKPGEVVLRRKNNGLAGGNKGKQFAGHLPDKRIRVRAADCFQYLFGGGFLTQPVPVHGLDKLR